MCRFALYLGPPVALDSLLTRPDNSIINQSYHSHQGAEPLNGDGFGVAWWADGMSDEPAVFKDITPAWNNPNLREIARVTASGALMAHVRAASVGMDVSRRNCHPFSHGRLAFMHNGFLAGFRRVRRELLAMLSDDAFDTIGGTTDSEHLFALFLDRYRTSDDRTSDDRNSDDRNSDDRNSRHRLGTALSETIRDAVALCRRHGIEEPSTLNLAVCDGKRAAVARYVSRPEIAPARSLYHHEARAYVCEDGAIAAVPHPTRHPSTLIASEPLTGDEDWREVPVNHMLLAERGKRVELIEITD